MEPDSQINRQALAEAFFKSRREAVRSDSKFNDRQFKAELRQVREQVLVKSGTLVDNFISGLRRHFPGSNILFANDAFSAVSHINVIAGKTKTISTNNSDVTNRETKSLLIQMGFEVINAYSYEYEVAEGRFGDYWSLPALLASGIRGSFRTAVEFNGVETNVHSNATKQYVALLGVSSAATDGSMYFLEHMHNIEKDLGQAGKVIIVVGQDKIVGSRQEAEMVAGAMGIYGMESALLAIQPRSRESPLAKEFPDAPPQSIRELNIIILDNGRSKLLESGYRDLLLCIGCRACNRHCPIRQAFTALDYPWTPRAYLAEFLAGRTDSLDVCLHCEACRLHCPLGIDLPGLMWKARLGRQSSVTLGQKLLGRPETIARLGSTAAPVANWSIGKRPVRWLIQKLFRIDSRAHLPRFQRNSPQAIN
jgi:L-lactate utilization protein LutB